MQVGLLRFWDLAVAGFYDLEINYHLFIVSCFGFNIYIWLIGVSVSFGIRTYTQD